MPEPYYPQVDSCQIPPLAFLLEKYLGRRNDGTFIEIGAFDGVHASNTWGLAARGWRGCYVEPVPHHARECVANHRNHPGIDVVEVAITGPNRTSVELTVAGPLTTGHQQLAEAYGVIPWAREQINGATRITVPATTADSLFESWLQGDRRRLDLLVVDVEGMELEVFSGLTLERWRPTVLIVELMDNHPEISEASVPDARLYRDILAKDYLVVFKNTLNTVFVDRAHWQALHHA